MTSGREPGGGAPPDDRIDAHTVESDSYDRAAIARLRRQSRAWRDLDEQGSRLVPHFDHLLDDVFCALFKYNVIDLPEQGMPGAASLARRVVRDLREGAAYAALRPETLLDEAQAGLATVSIGESLLVALRDEKILTPSDLLDLWDLDREEKQARQAEEEAEAARDIAAEAEAEAEAAEEERVRAREGENHDSQEGVEPGEPGDAEGDAGSDVAVGETRTDGPGEIGEEGSPGGEAEQEGSSGGGLEQEGSSDGEPHPGGGGDPADDRRASLERTVRATRKAARLAEAQRRQKERRVREGLDRVGSRLERSLLGAAAQAATRVQDLPDALSEWGRGLGAGGKLDAGQRIDLGRRLADNPKLKKLARVFGRMRDNALAVRRKVFERADQEMFEVGRNRSLDDIARLVPHELVALSHPVLRKDVLRRLLDGGLLTYSLRGVDSHGHGPMVLCLDTSSSMSGDKEIWSKAVTLTFVEIARRQRRRCHVVCFADATALREFDMNPGRAWQVEMDETIDLAEHFSGGGTDFMAPLDAAVEKLSTRELRRADVVLITDGECAVDPLWQEEFLRQKKRRNFSLYAILIDQGSVRGSVVEALADRVSRISELTEDGREIFSRPVR